MNTINIFWIEDNPVQDDFVVRDRIKYPSFNVSEGQGLFSFKLFQHPVEVQEYLAMMHTINMSGSSKTLAQECPQALPDIVVFDYKLSDNFSTSNPRALQYNRADQNSFLREHSASLILKECFKAEFDEWELFIERPNVLEGNYDSDELKAAIGVDELSLNDEFGLYAGIAVVREFKDFITLGVPATFNKADKKAVSQNSLFYEWLNSYDIKDAIQRPDKGSKNWNDILKFALPLLRRRIVAQIRSGKITPYYDQLFQLSNDGPAEDGVFSFSSAYGERHLSLAGLFIDEPEATRTQEIKTWAETLIDNLPKNNADIDRAIAVSEVLWNTYTSHFEDRVLLSDYTLRRDKLNKAERAAFEDIKLIYCNGTERIAEDKEVSIDTLLSRKDKVVTKRLAILLTVARAWIQIGKCKKNALPKMEYAQIGKEDYVYMLFPITNTKEDLLLAMHKDKGKDRLLNTFETSIVRKVSLPESPVIIATWDQFADWVTPGEKRLLNAIYFLDKEFLPAWVRH